MRIGFLPYGGGAEGSRGRSVRVYRQACGNSVSCVSRRGSVSVFIGRAVRYVWMDGLGDVLQQETVQLFFESL